MRVLEDYERILKSSQTLEKVKVEFDDREKEEDILTNDL